MLAINKSEVDINKTNIIYNAIENMRFVGTNLAKEAQDLYIENYKALMSKSKENLNKWDNIPYS